MKLNNPNAELYIPDGTDENTALSRTTDLCIAAHQDDIEIMAFAPAAKCYGKPDRWFTGVVVTDGAGSPRTGIYENYTDEEMKRVRIGEQKRAAAVGGYSAQFLLGYPSGAVKNSGDSGRAISSELAAIIDRCAPEVLYIHNFADKHDTHVAVALRAAEAVRSLPADRRPSKIYALEVWRGLDWLCDEDKTCFDTSEHPNLAAALLGVYDSQIAGGKRYDSAALGRRLANATFYASHDTDSFESCSYGIDITDFINGTLPPQDFICEYIHRFEKEVRERIRRLSE